MDNQAKWGAFRMYDFSKEAEATRNNVAFFEAKDYIGMSAILTDICGDIYFAEEDRIKNSCINLAKVEKKVRQAYEQLHSRYNSINFGDIDKEDSDFAVFFKTKSAIDELEEVINSFFKGEPSIDNFNIVFKNIKSLMQQHTEIKKSLEKKVTAGV